MSRSDWAPSLILEEPQSAAGELESWVPFVKPHLPPLDNLLPLLSEIWDRGWVTNDGPVQRRLEANLQRRLGGQNVVATANGTLALQLACRSLGLEGEVVVPSFTFPATFQSLLWNSLVPVPVDVEPGHMTIDPEAAAAAITSRTSAIVAVHTFGHPADVVALRELANGSGLALVYDAASAVGVRVHGEPITAFGDASAFSFHATKVMHTVEGGAVTTPHASVADAVRRLRNFGLDADRPPLSEGTNAKLNELEAAVGLLVLDALPEEISGRALVMDNYTSMLANIPGVSILSAAVGVQPNHAYAAVRLRNEGRPMADHVHRALKLARISSRRYFNRDYRLSAVRPRGGTPVADMAADDVLCLPLWAGMPRSTVWRISHLIEEAMA